MEAVSGFTIEIKLSVFGRVTWFSRGKRLTQFFTCGISIALAIHSFDPTKDAISDSAEYKITAILILNLPSDCV